MSLSTRCLCVQIHTLEHASTFSGVLIWESCTSRLERDWPSSAGLKKGDHLPTVVSSVLARFSLLIYRQQPTGQCVKESSTRSKEREATTSLLLVVVVVMWDRVFSGSDQTIFFREHTISS